MDTVAKKSKKKRRERKVNDNKDELISLLQIDFYYEFIHLRMIGWALLEKIINKKGILDIEICSFLLHYRNLYVFFHGSDEDREAQAYDYKIDWKGLKAPEEIFKWKGLINKFLSHLSYDRRDVKREDYPISSLYIYIRNLTIRFFDEIDKEFLDDKLISLLNEIKQESIILNQKFNFK